MNRSRSVRGACAIASCALVAGVALAHHSGFQVQDARKKLDEALVKTLGEHAWAGGAAITTPYVTRTRVVELRDAELAPIDTNTLPIEIFVQDAILPNCSGARRDFPVQFALTGLQGDYATVTKGVQAHDSGKVALALAYPTPIAGSTQRAGEPLRKVALTTAEPQTHDWTKVVTRQHAASFAVGPNKALVVRAFVAQWERLYRFRGKAVLEGDLATALANAKGKRLVSELLTLDQRSLEIAGQLKSFHLSELVVTQVERELGPGDCDAGKAKPEVVRLKLEPVPGLASLGTWSFMLRDTKNAEIVPPVDLKRIPGGALGFSGVGVGMVCYISACGESQAGARRIVRVTEAQTCALAQTVPDPVCSAAGGQTKQP